MPRLDRDSRCHGWSAACYQQACILCRDHRSAQIDTSDRAARSLAQTRFAVECDHEGGLAGLFLEPARDNSDHAGMPAFARKNLDRMVVQARNLFLRALLDYH